MIVFNTFVAKSLVCEPNLILRLTGIPKLDLTGLCVSLVENKTRLYPAGQGSAKRDVTPVLVR